jgi:adenine/guanine phosphoribosyltransferase-like PRPP-binding protein
VDYVARVGSASSDAPRPNVEWPITLLHDEAVKAIVQHCYSDVELRDRDGKQGRGFTNLKRIFGWPADLRLVVDALTSTVDDAQAIASADTGSAPLAALVAYKLGLPAAFVRSQPKDYFLSYGDDPTTNHPRLSGERLEDGTLVHVIDDFVHSGATLGSAVETLREVGVLVRTASSVLSSPTDAIANAIGAVDIHLTVLVVTDELFE